MRLFLLLAALPLWAADDANQILKRFAEAQDKNWEKAAQYAYTEELANFAFDKNGKPVQNGAAVRELAALSLSHAAHTRALSRDRWKHSLRSLNPRYSFARRGADQRMPFQAARGRDVARR